MCQTALYRIVQDRIPEAGVSLYFRLFYSSLHISLCMFLSSVSSRAVVASEVVFSLILLPVLVQSALKCLGVWCLNNIVWENVPVACDLKI